MPDLSVVLVTPDDYKVIRKTMGCLHKQTIRDRIEIVIVGPSEREIGFDPNELPGFHSVKIVETGYFKDYARVRAQGVRAATANVVAFAEEHCFPAPNWARFLVERHRQDYAVVCPVFANPNPRTAISWAQFYTEYGPFAEPHPGGEREFLAGNNSAYKRDVLMKCGERMHEALDSECVFHWQLRAEGHKLYLEPRARAFHLNMSRIEPFCGVALHAARLFASSRSATWSFPRRFVYAAASPLIPWIRLKRALDDVRRGAAAGVGPSLASLIPAMLLSLHVSALGECLGYLGLVGSAHERIFYYEFNRHRCLRADDRQTVEISDPLLAAAEL